MEYWVITTGAADAPGINGGLRRDGDPPTATQSVNAICLHRRWSPQSRPGPRSSWVATWPYSIMAVPGIGWLCYVKDPNATSSACCSRTLRRASRARDSIASIECREHFRRDPFTGANGPVHVAAPDVRRLRPGPVDSSDRCRQGQSRTASGRWEATAKRSPTSTRHLTSPSRNKRRRLRLAAKSFASPASTRRCAQPGLWEFVVPERDQNPRQPVMGRIVECNADRPFVAHSHAAQTVIAPERPLINRVDLDGGLGRQPSPARGARAAVRV